MKMKNKRVEELKEYFKTHNKIKEQKAHSAKVGNKYTDSSFKFMDDSRLCYSMLAATTFSRIIVEIIWVKPQL